jgi:formylglycine-generating enzyme required for sulfatase activity
MKKSRLALAVPVLLVFFVMAAGCKKQETPAPAPLPAARSEVVISKAAAVPSSAITELGFSEDGAFLLAGSADGWARVWNIASGALAKAARPEGGIRGLAVGEGIALWDGADPGEKGDATASALNKAASRRALGYADGSVILRDAASGAEIVRYEATGGEDGEWISITPPGYFNASANGGNLVSVQSGDETYTMTQLSEVFRRPDLLADAMSGKPVDGPTLADITQDSGNRPPVVQVVNADKQVSGDSAQVQVKVTVREGGAGYLVLRNGENVVGFPAVEEGVQAAEGVYELTLAAPVEPGLNAIGVSAFNVRHTIESEIQRVEVRADYTAKGGKPALYVLVSAINEYQSNRDYDNLNYTINDAEAIADLFGKQKNGTLYSDVVVRKVYGEEATRDGLARTFDQMRGQVSAQDTFVFFFAGHGNVDGNKDFFLVPYDTPTGKNIGKQDLIANITKIRAKNTLVLLDTCRSGALLDMQTAFGRLLEKLGQKAILMAASGEQSAVESGAVEHGVFTNVILERFASAPREGDPRFTDEKTLIDYVKEEVPQQVFEMQEAGRLDGTTVRGQKRKELVLQEPLARYPAQDFSLLDRYLEPGILTVSAASPGLLTVRGADASGTQVKAGERVERTLPEKTYTVAMLYADGVKEERTAEVRNNGKAAVRFEHLVPKPGVLTVQAKESGVLTIAGYGAERINAGGRLSKELEAGIYTLTMDYGEGHRETKTAELRSGGTAVVRFEYTVPVAVPPQPAPRPSEGMVYIQGGTFTMGSPASEKDRYDDETQHQVTISKGFWMGKYEVTQKEWVAVMGSNPSYFKGDNLPVENVSWYDAIDYCNKRSVKEGLTAAYTRNGDNVTWNQNANGYRLPTEAEWEYACRAGTTAPFSTGGNITTDQANYDGNNPYNGNAKGTYREKTWPVGSGAANSWGLYDMHGNVYEWCWDWYGSYASGSQTDPTGAVSGNYRVLRGGGWSYGALGLRSASRDGSTPSDRVSDVGFRFVRP